jgi:hypothetical protein
MRGNHNEFVPYAIVMRAVMISATGPASRSIQAGAQGDEQDK